MGCGIDKKAMRDVMALVESVGHFAPISTVVEETSLTNKETVHDLMNLVAEYEYAVKELKFQGNQAKRDPDASAQEMMDAVEANLQRMDRVTAKIRKIVLGESIGQVVCPARMEEGLKVVDLGTTDENPIKVIVSAVLSDLEDNPLWKKISDNQDRIRIVSTLKTSIRGFGNKSDNTKRYELSSEDTGKTYKVVASDKSKEDSKFNPFRESVDVQPRKVQEASGQEISLKHKKLLKMAAKEKGVSEDEILKMWNADKPHFGGDGPHRYDDGAKECSYCLRPKDWVPQKDEGGSEEQVKWLPQLLEKDVKSFVGKVSSAAKWDIFQAYAFCVALLEDVNAHSEAKDVNELLLKEFNKFQDQ